MFRRVIISFFTAIGILASFATPAQAKEPPIYTALFSKLAVSGYDPVAYFTEGKPVKGDAKFTLTHLGTEWRFSSAENREKFSASPDRYAPQYGGYCAWAVSEGGTASADPLRWKIVGDKLYLNYDADVQKKWEMSIPELIKKADKNWPSVLSK
jgi:YHS domain-containing protein